MSLPRFLARECGSLPDDAELALDPEESRHLRDVLRGRIGDLVELFDGQGRSRTAELVGVTKRVVRLRLRGPVDLEPPFVPEIWMAVAAPKSDRLRWLVEKMTELGANRLIPLVTARAVVKPGTSKLERLEEASLQACKQCGRSRAVEIHPLMEWTRFWALAESELAIEETQILLADRDGLPLAAPTMRDRLSSARRIVVVVGPEGGLTDSEHQEAIVRGATAVTLGRSLLRIETAAIAATAILRSLTQGATPEHS
ncbi:MAG: RsmE family RNA methyltransferase [Planctomycetaceae bacterium]